MPLFSPINKKNNSPTPDGNKDEKKDLAVAYNAQKHSRKKSPHITAPRGKEEPFTEHNSVTDAIFHKFKSLKGPDAKIEPLDEDMAAFANDFMDENEELYEQLAASEEAEKKQSISDLVRKKLGK